jgi:threonine synthase
VAIPSAGNAASAMAAYAAAAGIEAHIFMPLDVPQANYLECKAYGAHVTLVDGLISDCGRMVAERGPAEGWFDVSTLKEPYRVEGKKTMGYEVAEQMDWELPDAIFYPTGGGVGMIGMWKAFDEMEKLGWIGSRRPKMIAVQAEGCQPIVRAFEEGQTSSRFYEQAHTVAAGLRVPKPLGDVLTLQAVRESGGTAIAVSDEEMLTAGVQLASAEGIYAAPEGAACVAGLQKLLASGFLKSADRIVLYNTGSGLKYPEAYSTRFPRTASSEQDKLGGLITPR